MASKLTPPQIILVEKNLGLAQLLAVSAWQKSRMSMEKHEVVAVAYEGLVKAARRYDPEKSTPETVENGKAFAGFARVYINGAILEWQRGEDHVPKRQRQAYKDLQASGYGAGRSHEELSALTGMDVDKIRAIAQAVESPSVSLDTPPDNWDDAAQYAVDVVADQNVEAAAVETNIKSAVATALESLPKLQQTVIVLRYYSGHGLPYIATFLGERLGTVREAHQEAILFLHDAMLKEAR